MQAFKKLEDLTSNQDEYNELYNIDHLFVIMGKTLDDNNLIDVISDIEHQEWYAKLRGPAEGPAKLHNTKNNQENSCQNPENLLETLFAASEGLLFLEDDIG